MPGYTTQGGEELPVTEGGAVDPDGSPVAGLFTQQGGGGEGVTGGGGVPGVDGTGGNGGVTGGDTGVTGVNATGGDGGVTGGDTGVTGVNATGGDGGVTGGDGRWRSRRAGGTWRGHWLALLSRR